MAEWNKAPLSIEQKIHSAIEDTNAHLLAILTVLQEQKAILESLGQKKEEPVKAPPKKK